MGRFLDTIKNTLESDCTLRWAPEEFLLNNKVGYWNELPLWIPESLNMPGFLSADNSKAIKEGLTFRDLEETIIDTLKYSQSRGEEYIFKAGLKREKEMELLKTYTQ